MNRVAPTISIVTPSFNQGAYIEEALWSVKDQGYPALEHLVIDGASTDGTLDILRHYSSQPGWEHLQWISEPDGGQSDALNKGFRRARGEIIGWLNSDDRYRPGCFQIAIAELSRHSETDLIYGDCTWIDETGRVTQIRREIEFSHFILLYHSVLYVPTPSTFFRRRVFDEGNLLDSGLKNAMDYEFFLRLAQRGYRFRHVSKLLADFRWHGLCKSVRENKEMLSNTDRIRLKYSPVLRGLPEGIPRVLTLKCLGVAATGLRYAEKLLRGYYFTQFRPQSLAELEREAQHS